MNQPIKISNPEIRKILCLIKKMKQLEHDTRMFNENFFAQYLNGFKKKGGVAI